MATFTELVRRDIKKTSTKGLLTKYKTFNNEGRSEARKELDRRGVKSSSLPYKKREPQQKNNPFGSVFGYSQPKKKKGYSGGIGGYW